MVPGDARTSVAAKHLLDVHTAVGLLHGSGEEYAQTRADSVSGRSLGQRGHDGVHAVSGDIVWRIDAYRFLYAYRSGCGETA